MNQLLEKNLFAIMPDLISADRANQLACNIREEYICTNRFKSDEQVPNSPSFYNLPLLVDFHRSTLHAMERFVGEPLIPTYTYGRIYKHGAVLKPHRDRDACEISVTLNLFADHPWAIWFENSTGEKTPVSLEPGSSAAYRGCDALHWRDAFEGTESIQVFLHFVLKNGNRTWALQ